MEMCRWIVIIIGISLIPFVLYFGAIILISSILNYHPKDIEELNKHSDTSEILDEAKCFSVLSWNIGYCGLGAEMDFFYDGGENVKTPQALVEKYSKGIIDFLRASDSVDFLMLQEVDIKATRSSFRNQFKRIENSLPEYFSTFAYNYRSFFVPVPISNPMGKVISGIASFSKNTPKESLRYNYHSSYSWPKKLFMLNRCFMVNKFRLSNGKELVIVNTHNSAFDTKGKLKQIEMTEIRDFMLKEYQNGNYVVAGGDWNQTPRGVNEEFTGHKIMPMDKSLFPKEWNYAFTPEVPTNRYLNIAWDKQKTTTTLIDFFIVSPNITIVAAKTIKLNFKFSDHEPILLQFKINQQRHAPQHQLIDTISLDKKSTNHMIEKKYSVKKLHLKIKQHAYESTQTTHFQERIKLLTVFNMKE